MKVKTTIMNGEDTALAGKILSELRGEGGVFGIAYLQIKYGIGFGRATRIADYFVDNKYAEKGDFGAVTLTTPAGDDVSCKLTYKVTVNGAAK